MKKKRAANFTSEEKEELLESVLKYRDVLFGRVTLYNDWPQKNVAWTKVLEAVNSVSFVQRTLPDIRRKLKDLKAATRKKYMECGSLKNVKERKDLTVEEYKILSLLCSEEGKPENMEMVKVKEEKLDDSEVNPEITPEKVKSLKRSAENVPPKPVNPSVIMPTPVKKIKLIMKNIPVNLMQTPAKSSTQMCSTSNVPPKVNPARKDACVQTDTTDLQFEILRSIIDTQELVAKTLIAIEKIVLHMDKK